MKSDLGKLTDEEYNMWFTLGYASFSNNENIPSTATDPQIKAWGDGLNTAVEEDES